MTGDVKIELTITAEAVEKLFSLLGLLKESREETREETSPTPLKEENKGEKKESNISSCNYVDDVVVASKPAIKPIASNLANKVSNSSVNDDDVIHPPTKEEITEYVNYKGYKLNVDRFYLYYSRLGWCNKAGVSIIKTWKEQIDCWMSNDVSKKETVMQPVDKSTREALKATHPFVPTEF